LSDVITYKSRIVEITNPSSNKVDMKMTILFMRLSLLQLSLKFNRIPVNILFFTPVMTRANSKAPSTRKYSGSPGLLDRLQKKYKHEVIPIPAPNPRESLRGSRINILSWKTRLTSKVPIRNGGINETREGIIWMYALKGIIHNQIV
jgi:hypothetical protein